MSKKTPGKINNMLSFMSIFSNKDGKGGKLKKNTIFFFLIFSIFQKKILLKRQKNEQKIWRKNLK